MECDQAHEIQPPQPKRQRTLACRRCRHRKQKCDDQRPCNNCRKAGEECIPTSPAPPRAMVDEAYVKALEDRVAHLQSTTSRTDPDLLRQPIETSPRVLEGTHVRCSTADQGITYTYSSPSDGYPRRHSNSSGASSLHIRANNLNSPTTMQRIVPATGSDVECDLLLLSLLGSLPASCDAVNTAASTSPNNINPFSNLDLNKRMEELLIDTYLERAQPQYPFLHWPTFMSWLRSWQTSRNMNSDPNKHESNWKGFFVQLVLSTALLLLHRNNSGSDANDFYRDALSYLPSVLSQKDQVLHAQAYLLLAIHGLHTASSQRIISIASVTMRHCVKAQLHLTEAEEEPLDAISIFHNQIRRRVFWCAYRLDRLVAASFELPPSIADNMISTKMYANVDDSELLNMCHATPLGQDLNGTSGFTSVSVSLHNTRIRRIQSEALNYILHSNYRLLYEQDSEWRARILSELDRWKAQAQQFSDHAGKSYTSYEWFSMIYFYSLIMLYRPTQENVTGKAGDWAVQACCQAILSFRKFQANKQIAQPWLGLLVQFQAGITLLYCLWATPPHLRTASYRSPDVPDAIRACSNILAIVADRWPQAECIRDSFDLLAREIPSGSATDNRSLRVSTDVEGSIRKNLPTLRNVIIHRPVIRMIEEIIAEDSPSKVDDLNSSTETMPNFLEPGTFSYYPGFQNYSLIQPGATTFDLNEAYWPNFEISTPQD